MTIKEMREKRARIIANARAKRDEIKDDTPAERAAEINREFDAMITEAEAIGDDIARLERLGALESSLESRDSRVPTGSNGSVEPVEPEPRAVSYREAFHEYLRSAGNVMMLSPEVRNVLMPRQAGQELRAQTTVAAAGGYTVPTELAAELIKALAVWGPMFDQDICRVLNTGSGNPIQYPTVDDTAGTAAASAGEAVTLTDDGGKDVSLGQNALGAYTFDTEWIRVSLELMQDSIFGFEQLLAELLAERIGRTANSQLTIGTGAGAPQGIVTGSTLGKTAAGTAAIVADELLDLYHSVDPAYRQSPRARMMFNDNTLLALHKLKDGQGNYLITDAPDGSGRVRVGAVTVPYSVNQAMADIGTGAKPIVYGDFGKYFVRKVGSPIIGAIQDKDFWPGFGIAGVVRLDGGVADTRAIKHLIMS